MKKFILIIAGPTGVGKTDLALNIGSNIPAEIINIDVGQFYEPLSIGTAKPDWKSEPVPHHLFDIIKTPGSLTVSDYSELVVNKINDILSRGKLPILVGGSGFYINSLFFAPGTNFKSNLNYDTHSYPEEQNQINLWAELNLVDPERAGQINKNDTYRIKRALEIYKATGIKSSEYMPAYSPFCDYMLIVLTRDREELYDRINRRVIQMIESGWLEEVKKLTPEWKNFLKQKKIIGYDDILSYFEALQDQSYEVNQDLLIESIQQKTRNYAKRQLTFFRMLTKKITKAELDRPETEFSSKKIVWADLTDLDIELLSHELIKDIKKITNISDM